MAKSSNKLDLSSITAAANSTKAETFVIDLGEQQFTADSNLSATVLEELAEIADTDIPRIVSMAVKLIAPDEEQLFREFVEEKRFNADQVGLIIEGIVAHATGKA